MTGSLDYAIRIAELEATIRQLRNELDGIHVE